MKRGSIFLFMFFILYGCIGDGKTAFQREYLKNLKPNLPTHKEREYILSLEKANYSNIDLAIPNIGLKCRGCSTYTIKMDCPFDLTVQNQDSVIQANIDIAHALYTKVIEDSIIIDFGELCVEFSVDHTEIKKWHHILVRCYNKQTLERWGKFKVIERSEGKFERAKFE